MEQQGQQREGEGRWAVEKAAHLPSATKRKQQLEGSTHSATTSTKSKSDLPGRSGASSAAGDLTADGAGQMPGQGGEERRWAMLERATTTYQGRSAMAGTQRSIRGAGRVDFAAPVRPEHASAQTPEHRRADTSWMPRQLHSPPRRHHHHAEEAAKRRSGPGVDAQEATREYLRLLAAERARRRNEREPGYQPPRSPPEHDGGSDDAADAFAARSAAAAKAYEQQAREKRESKLMWNTARVWVDIIVEQAVFESEQRARAAARLQARVRGDQQRSESKRMRRAIVKVQAAARARQARGVLSMLQGGKARKERELAERNRQREENRERSAEERLLRLQEEASMRADAGQQARSLRQSRAVAEELICMACDNDVGPLAQLLRETPGIEQAVNLTDSGGWTPLMWGASLGHAQVCRLLLQASASVHPRDGDGWDALMLATDRSHIEPVELLLEHNADATLEAKYGRSSLSVARAQGSRGVAMLALLERPATDQQQRPSSAPATPAMNRSRTGGRPGARRARPSTAGGYGGAGSSFDTNAVSPTRMAQRSQRPSTAARELQAAIEQMNDVGMHVIGSAGFSTIIQARHLGIDTVIEAMLAYAEHHGVQHFGVAALAEQHENAPGSLQPSNMLCSALVQASAAHPTRQLDVVFPAMSLLAQTFLDPLALAPTTDTNSEAEVMLRESLGEAIAAAMCVASTAVGLRVMLMHDIRTGDAVDDLDDVPHSHIEDLLELILLGLRCGAAGSNGPARDCCPTLVEGGLVQPLVTIVHVYGRSHRRKVDFVRMAAAALCLLAAPQPRYSCELGACSGGVPRVMPTLRRRRQLTLISAEGLRFCMEGPRGSGSAMNPYAVVWWEGERLGCTDVVLASESPAWGTTLQFTLPPQMENATLRIEVYSEAKPNGGNTESGITDRIVGGVTLQLGGSGNPGSTEVVLPPFVAQLSASTKPLDLNAADKVSSVKSRLRPQSAKTKSGIAELTAGHVMISIDEQVGGFKLTDLVSPASGNFVRALAKADGLRTLVHACCESQAPSGAVRPPEGTFEQGEFEHNFVKSERLTTEEQEQEEQEQEQEEPLTEAEEAAEQAADAQMLLDVLRMGASTALAGCRDVSVLPALDMMQLAVADADSLSGGDVSALVDDLLIESGLIALARSTLLPQPDPEAAAERSAGKAKLSDGLLATLALRASACLAAVLEAKPGMDLSISSPSGESAAGLVLDGVLAHADLAAEHCNPVLDAAWLLLHRLSDNLNHESAAKGTPCAARATISKIARPHAVRVGAMSIAAGEMQARALHCVHWLWYCIDTNTCTDPSDKETSAVATTAGWDWANDVQVDQLVPPVLKLLEGSGGNSGGVGTVGQQQDEACRLVSLLLREGPVFLRSALLEAIGSGGGMLRLRQLLDDGTPALSWSKAYAAAALQAAQRLCAPTSRLPVHEQLQLALSSSSVSASSGHGSGKGVLASGLGRSGAAMLSNVGSAAVNFIERRTGLDIDGDGDVGMDAEDRDELLRRQQPVLSGLAVARRAGILMELQPAAIGAALFPAAPRPKGDQRTDREVAIQERHDGLEEASVLALVLAPTTDVARLDRQLLDCMVEMAYWRRKGEDVLAPGCVLGVLGLDGRGVGSQGSAGSTKLGAGRESAPAPLGSRASAAMRSSWKALGLSVQELPALVLIRHREVIELKTYGQVDQQGGMCSRGGENAVSTALPALTKDTLQSAVELMLRSAH